MFDNDYSIKNYLLVHFMANYNDKMNKSSSNIINGFLTF